MHGHDRQRLQKIMRSMNGCVSERFQTIDRRGLRGLHGCRDDVDG
jgi:hypothetical protein